MNWKTTMYIDKVWIQWSAHHHQRKHHPILYVSALVQHSAGWLHSLFSLNRSSTQQSPQPNTNIIPKSFIHWTRRARKCIKSILNIIQSNADSNPNPSTHTLTFLYRNQHSQSWLCIIWHPRARDAHAAQTHTPAPNISWFKLKTPQNDIILVFQFFDSLNAS